MKKAIYLVLSVALAATLSNCTNKQKQAEQTTEPEVVIVEDETPAYVGVYEGTLPCADCPGIKTVLTINADSTYRLTSEYLEKEDGFFEQQATYSLIHNGEVIEFFTPSTGEKFYYRILDGALAVSDEKGTVNEGEHAADYILQKK